MKRKSDLNFFDISSNINDLPKNELFTLKGGYSDIAWWDEIDNVDVYPPDNSDPWGDNNDFPWGGNDPWDDDSYDKDYWENIGDGGGSSSGGWPWGSGSGSNSNNSDTSQNDPFKRDSTGNLIITNTGISTSNSDYGVTLIMDQVKIELANGQSIIAHKVGMVYDPNLGENRAPTDAEKSNCFGQALLGGEFWFGIDTPNTPYINEGLDLEKLLGLYFEETTKDKASIAIVDHGGPYHAGIVNQDGTYTAKGGAGQQTTYDTEDDFRGKYYTKGDIVYYKLK